VSQKNFTDWDRDKAFGFLLVYNYFHQFSNSTFFIGWFWIRYWVHFVLLFGDMEEILLFTIIITMCPGVPDPRCDSGAKWAYLKWLFLSGTKVKKKKRIHWEVASKCNPNFETSKFLSRRKQAQDYMHAWQKRDFSQPRSQGPLSSFLEKVPWLRLVTCLRMPTKAAQRLGPQLKFSQHCLGRWMLRCYTGVIYFESEASCFSEILPDQCFVAMIWTSMSMRC